MSYIPIDPQSALALYQHGQVPGLGAYAKVGDYSWEFFGPEAFAWERPADSTPQPAPMLSGLGGCGCGGKCGGCGDGHSHGGLGQGVLNTGLLSTTDFSQWTWQDWAVAAVGIIGGVSILSSLLGVGKSAQSTYRGIRRAQKRKARAQAYSTLDTL